MDFGGISSTGCPDRILITENRQDFIDLHRAVPHHAGIIIFKHDRDYAGKIKVMIDFLNEDGQSLENRLLRVMKQNMKAIRPSFVVQDSTDSFAYCLNVTSARRCDFCTEV